MASPLKISLQLTAHNRSFEVRAISAAGEAKSEDRVPPQAFLDELLSNNTVGISPKTLTEIGMKLYKSLLKGDVGNLVNVLLREGIKTKQPVHLELRFDPDQVSLAQYPWEIIADGFGRFLLLDGLVDITRYISYPQALPQFEFDVQNLSLLRIIALPAHPGLDHLQIDDLTVPHVETIYHASYEEFHKKILMDRPKVWGLQFDGHGYVALECPYCSRLYPQGTSACAHCGFTFTADQMVGALAFEQSKNVDWITAKEFGSTLFNSGINFALLLACDTARVGQNNFYCGLASGLVLAGVPAVLGMQFPVLDTFANHFANSFYTALSIEPDLMKAVRTARRMNIRGEWYNPVLYLRYQENPISSSQAQPVYKEMKIDTAVPASWSARDNFLVRLWIRRPSTSSWPNERLEVELGYTTTLAHANETSAEVRFDPKPGRGLRYGELTVTAGGPAFMVQPEQIHLFVNEKVDAPAAIFTVRAQYEGYFPFTFTVWQGGYEIASIVHTIQIIANTDNLETRLVTDSKTININPTFHEVQEIPASQVEVILMDQAGGKTVTAKLPTDVQMQRLIPALVTKMQLPTNVSYQVHHNQSGKTLSPTDTLFSAGIRDGDTLRFLPNVRAGCFLQDTKVTLPDGSSKAISQLKVGEAVQAYDLIGKAFCESKILTIFTGTSDEYYEINGHLKVTGTHPIYANQGWTTVEELRVGDLLYDLHLEQLKVETLSVKHSQNPVPIYNLHLQQEHTFFANGVLVHNAKIIVTVTDQAGGKTVNASLPDDVPLAKIMPTLVNKMQLPTGNYVLQSKMAGALIPLDKSLSSAGVRENDTLRLLQNVTAGGSIVSTPENEIVRISNEDLQTVDESTVLPPEITEVGITGKKTILMVPAAPKSSASPEISKRINDLISLLKKAQLGTLKIAAYNDPTSQPAEFVKAIHAYKPSILHYIGKDEQVEGITFQDDIRGIALVNSRDLSLLMNNLSNEVNCVVLQACFDFSQAIAISDQIDRVLIIRKKANEDVVNRFVLTFYQALNRGSTIDDAFGLAFTQDNRSDLFDLWRKSPQ